MPAPPPDYPAFGANRASMMSVCEKLHEEQRTGAIFHQFIGEAIAELESGSMHALAPTRMRRKLAA